VQTLQHSSSLKKEVCRSIHAFISYSQNIFQRQTKLTV